MANKTNPLLKAAYMEGYQKGLREGKELADMTIADNDLMFVYGMMCIWLKETQAFGQRRIEKACRDIQKMWCNYAEYVDRTRAEGNVPETVIEMVERITGVNFMQILEGEVEKEETE